MLITHIRGRIDTVAEPIHTASDEEAIAKAVKVAGNVEFELWDGDRRVTISGRGERDADRHGDQAWTGQG